MRDYFDILMNTTDKNMSAGKEAAFYGLRIRPTEKTSGLMGLEYWRTLGADGRAVDSRVGWGESRHKGPETKKFASK